MRNVLAVVCLVLLVLTTAVGLRNVTVAQSGSDVPVLMAHGSGPVPPRPWRIEGSILPSNPLEHGSGPVPPRPWRLNQSLNPVSPVEHGSGPVPPRPWRLTESLNPAQPVEHGSGPVPPRPWRSK